MNAPGAAPGPASAKPLTAMQVLSNRVRRIMLVAGLGLLAAVIGTIITAPLGMKLAPKVSGLPLILGSVIGVVIWRFWLLVVLPVLGYGMGRALKLRPLGLAFGAAVSGELFFVLIELASAGLASLWANPAMLAARIGTLAFGVLLTLRATRLGLAAAERAQAESAKVSATRRDEYAELMAEAQRLAERNAAPKEPPPEVSGTAAPAPTEDPEKPTGTT